MIGKHRPGVTPPARPQGVSELTGLDQTALLRGDRKNRALTDEALWAEIDRNRRAEKLLVPSSQLALGAVLVLLILREVLFR